MSTKKKLKYLTVILLKIGILSSIFDFLYYLFYIAPHTFTGRGALFAYKSRLLIYICLFYFISKILFSLGVYLTLIPTIRNNTALRLIAFFAVPIYFLINFSTRSKEFFIDDGVVHIFYILVLVYYYWRFCLFLKKMSTENVL